MNTVIRLFYASTLLFSFCVCAQTVRDEGKRLLDEQHERERQQNLSHPPAVVKDLRGQPAPDLAAEDQPSFLITDIIFLGDTLLNENERSEVIAPFRGTQMGPKRIDLLLKRINALYLSKGYVTTRAYLGKQNLAQGKLEITIITGTVEKISIDGKPLGNGEKTAVPGNTGEPLRLTDIEQATDQINRLRSRRAEAQILPGQTPGGSVIAIDTHPEKPWRISLGVDNYGQSSTGYQRRRLTGEYDNLFGVWDAWSLTDVESDRTRSQLLAVSVPFGYGTASYAYAHSTSTIPIADIAISRSESSSHTLGWNQVLFRNQQSRYALDAMLALRDSDRSIDDVALTPQQQTTLRLAANSQFRFIRSALSAEIGYSKGLARFGGDEDLPDLLTTSPHNEFEKWDFNFAATASINRDWAWRGNLNGQTAHVGLPGQEQMFIGGAGSVRGFQEGIISADRGLLMRNELQWTGAFARQAANSNSRFNPFLFSDYSQSRLLAEDHDKRLSSIGLGLRASWKLFAAELAWGKPLSAPEGISRDDRLHFSLNLQF